MDTQIYDPFKYPPDYSLAKIHQNCTMPGKQIAGSSLCPCCSAPAKQPMKRWATRSIEHDFKDYGGAVVTYFWLVKLYAFICCIVLLTYSAYLIYEIHSFCQKIPEGEEVCQKFVAIWIITNKNLFKVIHDLNDIESQTRILTLRTMTYFILLLSNFMALYLSGRFKRRYPAGKDIGQFSLIFKNVKQTTEEFIIDLKEQFPLATLHEVVPIKRMEPFYSLYSQKVQTYYLSLIEDNPKVKAQLMKRLEALDRRCTKQQEHYLSDSGRIIVVFEKEADRNIVHAKYELSKKQRYKRYLGGLLKIERRTFSEPCPVPSEIIWHNLGEHEGQKIKSKFLSFGYFVLLLGGSYLIMFFCMKLVYNRGILSSPWNMIVANIIMIGLVAMALTFRGLMNKLSEMRKPNTQTHRTLFIIATTVLFHFIYYIIIPTITLVTSTTESNKILFIITNQTWNFLLTQFILAYIDIMFCQWNKRLSKVQDSSKPIGCQKVLHKYIQYPRFPIEFKLIILFKTFSFIILFAFESPFIMFVCFALLIFLYWFDKLSVYRHYRMEIIDNKVTFKFLKIYSNFFSVYTFLIYSLTQHFEEVSIEFYAALGLMVILVFLQMFVLKDKSFEDETIKPSTLQQLNIQDSYRKIYSKIKQEVRCDSLDFSIKEHLAKNGYGSLQTESSMDTNKLI